MKTLVKENAKSSSIATKSLNTVLIVLGILMGISQFMLWQEFGVAFEFSSAMSAQELFWYGQAVWLTVFASLFALAHAITSLMIIYYEVSQPLDEFMLSTN